MESLQYELEQLRRKLEHLELLREEFGDELTDRKKAELEERIRLVEIGGGTYVKGDVKAGGDFVGRDKIIHGVEVHGDKVGGRKVNISGTSGPVDVRDTTVGSVRE